MMKLKYLFITLFFLFSSYKLNAQALNYQHIFGKSDTIIKDIRFYGAYVHQHQDFFNKAFSFQGIETGVIINHKLLLGSYGSTFVTNLDVKFANNPTFVYIGQCGLVVGSVRNDKKVLHTGWLLNVGYFSLTGDDSNFALFKADNPSIIINGMVLSPQVYAELNIAKCMKLRTGLAYSFYSFEDQTIITKSDLNNISLTFGFIFGRFN